MVTFELLKDERNVDMAFLNTTENRMQWTAGGLLLLLFALTGIVNADCPSRNCIASRCFCPSGQLSVGFGQKFSQTYAYTDVFAFIQSQGQVNPTTALVRLDWKCDCEGVCDSNGWQPCESGAFDCEGWGSLDRWVCQGAG